MAKAKTPPPGRLPLPKRFPNRWVADTTVWTPDRYKLEIKGPIREEVGSLLIALLCVQDFTPMQLQTMRALKEGILPTKTPG